MQVIEWESSIKIYINKKQFDDLLKKINIIATDSIIYFTDNTRLAHRLYQKKILKKKEYILLYHKKNFFPIKRSISEEDLLPRPNMESLVIKNAISRNILYQDSFVRINLDVERTDIGNKYCLCSEIEYEEDSSYSTIRLQETKLVSFFLKFLKEKNLINLLTLDNLTTNDIFESVPNKMSMWYNLQKNEKKYWAYKWNGVKAKMCSSDFGKKITLWEDIKNIIEIQCTELYKRLPFLNNLCIQLEHVNDYYVLTEILSAKFNSRFYMIEPLTNIKLLYLIKKKWDDSIELLPNKRLYIQEYFDTEIPNSYDESKFDGFIVIQNEKILKYKIPTIDMKCIKGTLYSVSSKKFTLDFEGIPGKIYEVSSTFKVLRLRKDRISSGSDKEYEEFVKGCIYFNKYCKK
ncbi:late expression factor 4 [Gryllus bimaculatus nudivirus]|uniref:Late expression factor 4 n=1 Tax=Gryllus bimaculatus nudivirus TaxID=432587 RepID=A4L259_9VIRU|nr:late expression factor 4 [Gryllus bimaculatus nudivirus]ABO45429.1 late expression factor 4 [Gryllus bimaculatus nudivirus]